MSLAEDLAETFPQTPLSFYMFIQPRSQGLSFSRETLATRLHVHVHVCLLVIFID